MQPAIRARPSRASLFEQRAGDPFITFGPLTSSSSLAPIFHLDARERLARPLVGIVSPPSPVDADDRRSSRSCRSPAAPLCPFARKQRENGLRAIGAPPATATRSRPPKARANLTKRRDCRERAGQAGRARAEAPAAAEWDSAEAARAHRQGSQSNILRESSAAFGESAPGSRHRTARRSAARRSGSSVERMRRSSLKQRYRPGARRQRLPDRAGR